MTWENIIIEADCLKAIEALESKLEGKLRLIYLDPPFFSGTDYSIKKRIGGDKKNAPELKEILIYSDKWEGGLEEYLEFMTLRLAAMVPLLRDDGSLWIHLDWHVSHYIKSILDDLLGYDNFINEIIWRRTNSPKAQSRGFGSQHDVILLYAKDASKFSIKPIFREHDEKSLQPYSYQDDKGRFRLIEIEAQGIQRTERRKQFEWRGRKAPYLYKRETLDKWWEQDLIYRSKTGRYTKKQYLAQVPGILVSDLWLDIPPIQGSSKEYTGFLTQKPLGLLRRVIESASDRDDIVADFFAGSGTTAVAAQQLGRQWLICDISKGAIQTAIKRLEELKNEKGVRNRSYSKCTYQVIDLAHNHVPPE